MQDIKIDEKQVYKLLNKQLTEKLQIFLRGRVVNDIKFLRQFGLDFLSELINYFNLRTYVIDDIIFMERDKAESFYYIIEGKVAMIQKNTNTFIIDLKKS